MKKKIYVGECTRINGDGFNVIVTFDCQRAIYKTWLNRDRYLTNIEQKKSYSWVLGYEFDSSDFDFSDCDKHGLDDEAYFNSLSAEYIFYLACELDIFLDDIVFFQKPIYSDSEFLICKDKSYWRKR